MGKIVTGAKFIKDWIEDFLGERGLIEKAWPPELLAKVKKAVQSDPAYPAYKKAVDLLEKDPSDEVLRASFRQASSRLFRSARPQDIKKMNGTTYRKGGTIKRKPPSKASKGSTAKRKKK